MDERGAAFEEGSLFDTTRTTTSYYHLRDGLLRPDVLVVGGAQHYWASMGTPSVQLLATGRELRAAASILSPTGKIPEITDGPSNPAVVVVRESAAPSADERMVMARYFHALGRNLKVHVKRILNGEDDLGLTDYLKERSRAAGGVEFETKELLWEYVNSGMTLTNEGKGSFVPIEEFYARLKGGKKPTEEGSGPGDPGSPPREASS